MFSQTKINSPDLKSHITARSVGCHTHVEIIVASTYFQVPIYFLQTPSSMLKWEVFNP